MNDYRKALELDENFQRAKEGLDRSQKRQKQASKRDYYKILGVKRNARKKEINKAGVEIIKKVSRHPYSSTQYAPKVSAIMAAKVAPEVKQLIANERRSTG